MISAGVVVAGGRSTRMGESKALLDWHGTPLVRRVSGLLARTVDGPVVVVAADHQPLPALPLGVELVRDSAPENGPLQGMADGLAALTGRADRAFVCSVDLPFLHPAYVRRLLAYDAPAVVPAVDGRPQPLAAAYEVGLAARARDLLAAGERRATALAPADSVRPSEQHVPHPESARNLNSPADYAAALLEPQPNVQVTVVLDEAVGGSAVWPVRAATLGGALKQIGIPVRPDLTLNGRPIPADPELPLVDGDQVQSSTRLRQA